MNWITKCLVRIFGKKYIGVDLTINGDMSCCVTTKMWRGKFYVKKIELLDRKGKVKK